MALREEFKAKIRNTVYETTHQFFSSIKQAINNCIDMIEEYVKEKTDELFGKEEEK
jgi:hypothetical protein